MDMSAHRKLEKLLGDADAVIDTEPISSARMEAICADVRSLLVAAVDAETQQTAEVHGTNV